MLCERLRLQIEHDPQLTSCATVEQNEEEAGAEQEIWQEERQKEEPMCGGGRNTVA